MSADTPLTRLRIRSLTLLLAIFVSGTLAGLAIDRVTGGETGAGRFTLKRPAEENGIPTRLLRLGLTEDQKRRMRAISDRWQPQADSLMQEIVPRVREIEHGMFQEMACVLTPAQDSAYLAWRKKEGLNLAEGEEQLSRVREGRCPAEGAESR